MYDVNNSATPPFSHTFQVVVLTSIGVHLNFPTWEIIFQIIPTPHECTVSIEFETHIWILLFLNRTKYSSHDWSDLFIELRELLDPLTNWGWEPWIISELLFLVSIKVNSDSESCTDVIMKEASLSDDNDAVSEHRHGTGGWLPILSFDGLGLFCLISADLLKAEWHPIHSLLQKLWLNNKKGQFCISDCYINVSSVVEKGCGPTLLPVGPLLENTVV